MLTDDLVAILHQELQLTAELYRATFELVELLEKTIQEPYNSYTAALLDATFASIKVIRHTYIVCAAAAQEARAS